MKSTVSIYDFRDAFRQMDRDYYSYEGYQTLFDYYEEYEDATGEEMELDVIAICCEWTEYTLGEMYSDYKNIMTFEEWLEDNSDIYTPEEIEAGEAMDDFLAGDFLEEMEQQTTILKVTGTDTYLVLAF